MTNLTLSIDDELLHAARARAAAEGTSVNEICRKAIEAYARADSAAERLRRFDAFMDDIHRTARKPLPAPWKSRDALYETLFAERGESSPGAAPDAPAAPAASTAPQKKAARP